MSIASEIQRLQNAKTDIKEAIENKGVTVGNDLIDTYANKINQIKTGIIPTGNIDIVENGTYNITDKATATVNVPTSGGSQYPIIEGDGEHEVRFVDYDGTLLKVQYCNDGESATAPELPEHERLTFMEWNRDYSNITHDIDTGACYKPTSGNTELFINVTEETGLGIRLNIYRSVSSGSITVNWGDGIANTFGTGTGTKTLTHTYSSYGEYMISIISSINYFLGGGRSTAICVMGDNEDRDYKALKKCYCSEKVIQLQVYSFFNNSNLEEFTMVKVTQTGQYSFYGTKQKAIILPTTVETSSARIASYCSKLEYLIFPTNITTVSTPPCLSTNVKKLIYPENFKQTSYSSLAQYDAIEYLWYPKPDANYTMGTSFAQYCNNLKHVIVYDNLTAITGTYIFRASAIERIAFPPSVTSIANYTLYSCGNLKDIYMYAHTPPTLSGTNVFFSSNILCKIHVYPEDLEAYQNTTNWSSFASKIVGDLEGEFKDGYCE